MYRDAHTLMGSQTVDKVAEGVSRVDLMFDSINSQSDCAARRRISTPNVCAANSHSCIDARIACMPASKSFSFAAALCTLERYSGVEGSVLVLIGGELREMKGSVLCWG